MLRTQQGEDQALLPVECRLDAVGAVPRYDDDTVGAQLASVIQHMPQHGLARNAMQHLGQIGLHPLTQAGGKNDDVQHSVNFPI